MSVPKRALRQHIRQQLEGMTREELLERSAAVLKHLYEQPEYRDAEVVMIFLSTPYEVDTQQLAQRAWADGKRVLAPRITWEQRRLLPVEITSLAGTVEDGEMGIRQPVEGLPVPVEDIDLVLLPGLAFDARGNRLGRGRGFYDRFLAHARFRGVSCALALEEQVIDHVPTVPTDKPVHMLVTDAGVRRFTRES